MARKQPLYLTQCDSYYNISYDFINIIINTCCIGIYSSLQRTVNCQTISRSRVEVEKDAVEHFHTFFRIYAFISKAYLDVNC